MVEVLSLGLAGAALLVALLTLYLSNVRRADIELVRLPRRPWLADQTHRDEGPPVRGEIRLTLVAINSGARPGVITGLTVQPRRDPLYEIINGNPIPNWRDGESGALPLLAGETRNLILAVYAAFADAAVDQWRAGRFRAFDVEVEYVFLRGSRFRRYARRHIRIPVDLDAIVWNAG